MNRQWTRRLAASLGLLSWLLLTTAAGAQTPGGVIAFYDACDARGYLIRGDGTGRMRLADTSLAPTDITRGGFPMPVLTADLQAVAVADIAGQLQAEPPVSLRPEEYISFIGGSAISLVANRIAYMTGDRSDTSVPKTFWIADLVRDGTGRISGATNHRVLAQDDEIGSPSDVVGESVAATYAGGMAFSPDCASLLVVVYADLWRLYLAADGSLLYPDRVTQTRTRAESSPAFSPDGRKLAFAAVDLKLGSGPWKGQYVPGSVNIYTLDLGYAATPVPLLNKSNLGEAVANTTNRFSSPTWSPDGAFIAFSAPGAKSKPTSPCYGTNTDIFVIRSNGSGQATALVRTAGTGLEIWPHWGSE